MNGKQPIEMTPAQKAEALKINQESEKTIKQVVLGFLREASQDPLGKDHYYKKYFAMWQTYVHTTNNAQKLVRVNLNAFEVHVKHMLELVEKQKEEKAAAIEEAQPGVDHVSVIIEEPAPSPVEAKIIPVINNFPWQRKL